MADDKVNMSLDEIIKLTKDEKKKTAKGNAKNVRTFKSKVGLARKGQAAGARAGRQTVVRTGRRFANTNKPLNRTVLANKAATKKLVQNLVKKALKRSNVVANRPQGFIRRVSAGPSLARVSQQSRVIGRSPVIARVQRGRGFNQRFQRSAQIQQRVVARQPVRVVRQQPVVVERVVERVVEQPRQQRQIFTAPRRVVVQQPQRQRVIQQQPRQRVIQRQAPRIIQRTIPAQQFISQVRPARKNFIRQAQVPRQQVQKVIYVQQPQAQAPRRNRFNNRPQQQVVQYVNSPSPSRVVRRNVQVQRFEPSSSFITRQVVVRRGRGFSD